MYLKSLNVVGFKSFADRTTLEFHPGVTAIVGPNGCGKSNVLDSIRWVLGEQSAKALRGGEMKDVIFSGTETRPPLGMAEVSLTFGDCEKDLGTAYNEVTITRRVFRDGASEYELNKTPCRLRDIHSMFMDTGIGRSAYSIMEQGKIDSILSSRPEDRRAIFEEAAGITKYKSQKKEALRKLENTEANLIRLADIIREVKRQIGSLQRQAGKARRYQASFEELATLENRLGRHQFDTFSATIATLQVEVDGAREKQEQLDAERHRAGRKSLAARERICPSSRRNCFACARSNRPFAMPWNGPSSARRRIARAWRNSPACAIRPGRKSPAPRKKSALARSNSPISMRRSKISRGCGRETQQRFDEEQEALQMLTAQIGNVESERAEIEAEKFQQERLHQRQEQELAGLELQQRNFQLQDRGIAVGAGLAGATSRRSADRRSDRSMLPRLAEAETLLRERREALQHAQQARREAEEKLREAEQVPQRDRPGVITSCRRDAMRWPSSKTSMRAHRRRRSVCSRPKRRKPRASLHGTLSEPHYRAGRLRSAARASSWATRSTR